jgi:hypothetical protein
VNRPIPDLPMSRDPAELASSNPVRDHPGGRYPGATADYLVVPRSLAQSMPLRWQQLFLGLLDDLHDAYRNLEWPEYQVVAGRMELLADLDERQLAAVGYVADLDSDGELIFRDVEDEQPVPEADQLRVLAPVRDPIPPASAGRVPPRPAEDRIAD